MRSCVQRTGGVALSAESFGAPQLLESLRRLLAPNPNPNPNPNPKP